MVSLVRTTSVTVEVWGGPAGAYSTLRLGINIPRMAFSKPGISNRVKRQHKAGYQLNQLNTPECSHDVSVRAATAVREQERQNVIIKY